MRVWVVLAAALLAAVATHGKLHRFHGRALPPLRFHTAASVTPGPGPAAPSPPTASPLAPWYSCPTSKCRLPGCRCASTKGPLPLSQMPQFVLITNDDAVDGSVVNSLSFLLTHRRNANGCPVPATWFTSVTFSDCGFIRDRFSKGDEFACHSITHPNMKPGYPRSKMVTEIAGSREFLVKKCGLPKQSVKGYRATYLMTTAEQRDVIHDLGFLYESSVGFDYEGAGDKVFPFTEDYGIPDRSCSSCKKGESNKGLWMVPVWPVRYKGHQYSMDPGMKVDWEPTSKEASVYDVMKSAFDGAYKGNRAPVGIMQHNYWQSAKRLKEAQKFLDYALTQPDTWAVTMRQLVDWMRDPVPKDQVWDWLAKKCKDRVPVANPNAPKPPTKAPSKP